MALYVNYYCTSPARAHATRALGTPHWRPQGACSALAAGPEHPPPPDQRATIAFTKATLTKIEPEPEIFGISKKIKSPPIFCRPRGAA